MHCHGFAWADSDTDLSKMYRGNNLFYVSLYDHAGYISGVPGAPQCGCIEKMPVVTRSDCTEINKSKFSMEFKLSSGKLDLNIKDSTVTFAACQGNSVNNDLEDYYKKLAKQRKVKDNTREIQSRLVGKNGCPKAIEKFFSKLIPATVGGAGTENRGRAIEFFSEHTFGLASDVGAGEVGLFFIGEEGSLWEYSYDGEVVGLDQSLEVMNTFNRDFKWVNGRWNYMVTAKMPWTLERPEIIYVFLKIEKSRAFPSDYQMYCQTKFGALVPYVGGSVRIDACPNGNPVSLNSAGTAFQWNGASWTKRSGRSMVDVACGPDGVMWGVGTNGSVYSWNGRSWRESRGPGNARTHQC